MQYSNPNKRKSKKSTPPQQHLWGWILPFEFYQNRVSSYKHPPQVDEGNIYIYIYISLLARWRSLKCLAVNTWQPSISLSHLEVDIISNPTFHDFFWSFKSDPYPYHPWDWYIYLHLLGFDGKNVGQYIIHGWYGLYNGLWNNPHITGLVFSSPYIPWTPTRGNPLFSLLEKTGIEPR